MNEHSTSTFDKARIFELQRQLQTCFDHLDAWWRGWASENSTSCYERSLDSELAICWDEQGPVFSTVLYFDNFLACYLLAVHNSFRILLLGIWTKLSESELGSMDLPRILEEPNPLPVLGITTDANGLALEILRCLEYCATQSKKFLGTYCVLFPLTVVSKCYPDTTREGKWLWANALKDLSHDERGAEGIPETSCISAAYYNSALVRSITR